MSTKILGLSGSLRNARRGRGNITLIEELKAINSIDELYVYLEQQATQHLQNFMEAGRKEKLPFDELYRNLRKKSGDRGLSNSEVALAAALWAAKELKADIDHASLSEYFLENRNRQDIDGLLKKLEACDGIIISTPVYFGDRSSLPQSFLNLVKSDQRVAALLRDKIYAGIAVGAKRNGGQETTLIYQMMDMLHCDMLGVGNDSETTSQYGGTGHAGDVGTMHKDKYGIETAMGTGRRIARVASMTTLAKNKKLDGKVKLMFWILQDQRKQAVEYIKKLMLENPNIDAKVIELSSGNVLRCLACDICPTRIDLDEKYRCIINNPNDDMSEFHADLLWSDAVIPVAYCTNDRMELQSNYQRFMERTRYLRRGDYIFSDLLTAPLIIEEIGSHEHMDIRMITGMVRHHTILSKPMIAYKLDGKIINQAEIDDSFHQFLNSARTIAAGRMLAYSSGVNHLKYNPVGYVLSAMKDEEDEKMLRRSQMIEERVKKANEDIKVRIK